MPCEIKRSIFDSVATLCIHGKLTLQAKTKFSAAYADLLNNSSVKRIEISLDKVEYMDVSALGMLLLLKERALVANKAVSLINPLGVVAHTLAVAHFENFFPIDGLRPVESEAITSALG